MTEQVMRLIYMSKSQLPDDNAEYAAAIQALMNYSRKWNDDNGITGALFFSDGYFAQVLEAPKSALNDIIGKIICDSRHKDLRLIECCSVSERLFGNWSMAYTDGDEQLDLAMLDARSLPKESQGAAILRMLRHIVTPDVAVAETSEKPEGG